MGELSGEWRGSGWEIHMVGWTVLEIVLGKLNAREWWMTLGSS